MEKTVIKIRLQFFGGRGGGWGGGSGSNVNVMSQTDVWSFRHNPDNAPFVDEINTGVKALADDFPGLMDNVNSVNAAELGGADKYQTLGFYSPGSKSVSINTNYTDIDKMNKVYDAAVASGFHPSRGDKTGTQAVAIHEMGHALTGHIAERAGKDFDKMSAYVVNHAYAKAGGKGGAKKWAGSISKYAQENPAECIAEAVADWYCNGSKASAASKAIMAELKSWA